MKRFIFPVLLLPFLACSGPDGPIDIPPIDTMSAPEPSIIGYNLFEGSDLEQPLAYTQEELQNRIPDYDPDNNCAFFFEEVSIEIVDFKPEGYDGENAV